MSADLIRLFLADLETSRGCAIVSRNQRLTAIHALARFVGKHSHAHIAWCVQVRAIPFKKPTARAVIPYLDIDKSEQARKLGLVCRSALLLNHSLSLSIERRYWPSPIPKRPKGAATEPYCCSSTTRVHVPRKPPGYSSLNSF
jgi:hypothetical protein